MNTLHLAYVYLYVDVGGLNLTASRSFKCRHFSENSKLKVELPFRYSNQVQNVKSVKHSDTDADRFSRDFVSTFCSPVYCDNLSYVHTLDERVSTCPPTSPRVYSSHVRPPKQKPCSSTTQSHPHELRPARALANVSQLCHLANRQAAILFIFSFFAHIRIQNLSTLGKLKKVWLGL